MSHVIETIQSRLLPRWLQRANRYWHLTSQYCWLSWWLSLRGVWGRRGLEIGGPSGVFRLTGILPVYTLAARIDLLDFALNTRWSSSGALAQGARLGQKPGRFGAHRLAEAGDLHTEHDASHDFLLAAHVLEHLANPLRALHEWARVLKPDGLLVLVLPHREGTFDHRRPITTLAHLIADEQAQCDEADTSHLPEILALHDLSRDPQAGSRLEFERRSRDNFRHRCLHHHVFDTELALRMLDHAGWRIECVELRMPYHIVLTCRRPQVRKGPDNRAYFHAGARWRRRSPFAGDRGQGLPG